MDTKYANQCIDEIQSDYSQLRHFFTSLKMKETLNKEEIDRLEKMHGMVVQKIRDYYIYLEKVKVAPKDSYITAWLRQNDVDDELDIIEWFIEDHSSQSEKM